MSNLDFAILVAYVVGLFLVGIFVGIRETADDFLVLSRKAPFWLVLFSVVSTWVGAGTTIATAASGYQTGISLGFTAACGGLLGVIAAGLFAPTLKSFGDRFQAHTIGDFFVVRYSRSAAYIAGALIVVIYLFLTAGQVVALAAMLAIWTSVSFRLLLIFAAISTVLYTAFAGIKSDFYTDIIHFIVMAVVFFGLLLPIVFTTGSGFDVIQALPTSFHSLFAYGGVSFFVAGIVFGVGSIFVTMEIWQRIYASSTGRSARWSLMSSGVVIVAFYLASSVLGMVARGAALHVSNANGALFVVMMRYLPHGILGLAFAAVLAIIISTINSLLMVVSATLTKDFYKGCFRPKASQSELLRAGRLITLCEGFLVLFIAVLLPNIVALTVNSMFVLLCLVPAVVGGFFWRRGTNVAAMWSILGGIAALLALVWYIPNRAFAPAFFVSLVIYVGTSFISSHSPSENTALC